MKKKKKKMDSNNNSDQGSVNNSTDKFEFDFTSDQEPEASESDSDSEIPEDLYCLIKKAVSVRKHLERNRKDTDSKFRLILIESKIHRLARYYRRSRQLPANWRYESSTASALVA